MEKLKRTPWILVRQTLAVLVTGFSGALGVCYFVGLKSTDWPVAVCEWSAVIMTELYVITFYWDLGDEFFIEQIREYYAPGARAAALLQDDEQPMLLYHDQGEEMQT